MKESNVMFRGCSRAVLPANMIGHDPVTLMYTKNKDILKCFSGICATRTMESFRRTEVYLLSGIIKPKYLPIQLLVNRNRKESPCCNDCGRCSEYMIDKCSECPATMYYKRGIARVSK